MTVLAVVVALGGCGGANPGSHAVPHVLAPQGRAASDAATGTPGESATGLPGESATGLPGESATGLPGESATGLPGESATGLPGASFACTGIPQSGTANCTAAINLNVAPTADPRTPVVAIPGLHPADLQSAYALPVQNSGGTVAIVDAYDDPAAEADLGIYRAAFGLPPCTTDNGCFRKVNQGGQVGANPAPDAGWSTEIALDLDMVSAACPTCSIILVEANSALLDDLGAAVDTAAGLGANAVSNSYYAAEWSGESTEDAHYRHAGVAMTASSGDRGYPSYPAASRFVTSVGGTSLTRGSSGWTEKAWAYTGHGCSAFVARPSWQRGSACKSRSAVDVAAVADPQTGVSIFSTQNGGWVVAGGTSVGAPLVAAAYALSHRPAGPEYSYEHPSAFNAVGPSGYQAVTGLGSPNGVGGL